MAKSKQIKEMLLLSFIHGFITEQEFGMIHKAYQTKNLIFLHRDYDRSTLDNIEEAEIFAEFRVRKRDIETLAPGAARVIHLLPAHKDFVWC